ncbi:hypothetical protein HMPREF1421_00472, partial [Helicobacter pylori GAM265BSii]
THSLKGIGGYFAIIPPPFNPLKIPLTQEDRFFSRDYRLILKNAFEIL